MGTDPVRSVRSAIVLLKKQHGTGTGSPSSVSAMETLLQINQSVKTASNLSMISLKQIRLTNNMIYLDASVNSYSEIDQLEKSFKRNSFFSKVEIKNTRQNIRQKGVSFTIVAQIQ